MGDDTYLSFGVNPNANKRYVLLVFYRKSESGKVHYAGNEYYTESGAASA